VPSGRNPRYLVREIRGDVVLQKLPEVFDDKVRRPGLDILSQPLIYSDDIDKLMG
jgi:hypothetical protein